MSEDAQSDVDFVRFVGVRVIDADIDERGCKIVDGERSLGGRAEVRAGVSHWSRQVDVHS